MGDAEAFQVPRHVFADIATSLDFAVVRTQQFRVPPKSSQHLIKPGFRGQRIASESSRQVTEQPRTAETTATDNHTVRTGLLHHLHGVRRRPDISVAQHGNTERAELLLQARDR